MLKRISYLLTFVTLVSFGNAQLLGSAGFKVAYSSALQKLDFSDPSIDLGSKRIDAINVALFVEWFESSPVSILSQLEFMQRGRQEEFLLTAPSGPEPIGVVIKHLRISYLSVPVFAKLNILRQGISLYLLAGPRIDFMIAYKPDDPAAFLSKDLLAKTIVGASVGVGTKFPMFFFPLILDIRYNFDLKDSFNNGFARINNNALDIWLGVAFDI